MRQFDVRRPCSVLYPECLSIRCWTRDSWEGLYVPGTWRTTPSPSRLFRVIRREPGDPRGGRCHTSRLDVRPRSPPQGRVDETSHRRYLVLTCPSPEPGGHRDDPSLRRPGVDPKEPISRVSPHPTFSCSIRLLPR